MFSICTGGINSRHRSSFFISRPKGLANHVLLFVKVSAEFTIAGSRFIVPPNSALFIKKNTPYQYKSAGGEYTDDWLHFSCSDKDLEKFGELPFHTPVSISNPAKFTLYIQQLLWENHYTPEGFRQDNVNMLFCVLLNTARLALWENKTQQPCFPYQTRLQNLRLTILAQPYKEYSPEQIAASMGISASYFQHLYTDFFGISFRADLIGLRIEYAKDLILNTNLTMEKIAEMSGYNSEVHFYRQFKKHAGMTPAACRQMSSPHVI